MTMTTKELLALVGKATPGPWSVYTPDHSPSRPGIDAGDETIVVWGDETEDDGGVRGPANAALIVAAVNALPALCAEVEALQAVAEAARRSLSQTAANQRDGLVPTVYYRAHQDLANALAAIDAARSRNEHEG